jgi:hypothetical protein
MSLELGLNCFFAVENKNMPMPFFFVNHMVPLKHETSSEEILYGIFEATGMVLRTNDESFAMEGAVLL